MRDKTNHETHEGFRDSFYPLVILLDYVVKVLNLPPFDRVFLVQIKAVHGCFMAATFVQGGLLRLPVLTHRLLKEGGFGGLVPLDSLKEIEGPSLSPARYKDYP